MSYLLTYRVTRLTWEEEEDWFGKNKLFLEAYVNRRTGGTVLLPEKVETDYSV